MKYNEIETNNDNMNNMKNNMTASCSLLIRNIRK